MIVRHQEGLPSLYTTRDNGEGESVAVSVRPFVCEGCLSHIHISLGGDESDYVCVDEQELDDLIEILQEIKEHRDSKG